MPARGADGLTQVRDNVTTWLNTYASDGVDVAWLLCDRHESAATAFRLVGQDMQARDLTYGELSDKSARLARVLAVRHGVGPGDCVPVLMGKRTELVVTLIALWRLGAVHVPLFTAFATGAVEMRVKGCGARLVITEPSQRSKLEPIDGVAVLEVGDELDATVRGSEPLQSRYVAGADGPIVQLYTSGTTGKPKGVPVPARALAAFHCYMHYGLDVTAEDRFWNAADPGWAYGLYYGILGPLAAGRTNILVSGGFTPEATVEVIKRFGVTNFAGAPTIYRALSKSGLVDGIALRRASSAGEPLTSDVVSWAIPALGVEIRDHYGQTELGMVINNHWHPDVAMPLKKDSMGQAMPGYAAAAIDEQIVIDVNNSPLWWFPGYQNEPDRTAERFLEDGRWYLTGDTGRVDDDGYFFFAARNDDVILAAGYRIGPFDVENVLLGNAHVVDVAVVGRPDPEGIRGEVVEAFVVLDSETEPSEELAAELQNVVRDTYSKHAYPRTVHFVDQLPKTPSGKVQRYLLR
jgi:acetyl-CoA synthetase